ncbi:plastocyanin/azurin family copper-binding protein [Halobaculum sp. CBA1158]|uniref:plastocyanin/azurin family copper-binding protein n=1 Tax=Halobaculum sp. CBA1158 TaxID=2904243 RepID=UPI001F32FAEA|nr:plastocyanin/azurin family copper-binding protein [Halobaculum sp. CBA1158]UIP00850.1 plastocyanin/azurin family copper-binding protein [Halobaculum sp. CBA1158]
MKRRDFMRQAGGATAALGAGATATAGTATAQEEGGGGGQQPDFGGYTDGAEGGSYEDLRGESEVTIEVGAGGGLAFTPTEAWIDTGTTVVFEWVSDGHNVLFDDNPGDVSGHEPLEDTDFSFEVTFESGGVYTYYCDPHRSLGMLGAIAVGEEVPTVSTGGGGGRKELHDLGVAIQAHWVGAATILGIIMTVIFTFYVVKYGESAHTGTGR